MKKKKPIIKPKWILLLADILSGIHLLLFYNVWDMMQGHPYGEPDKYGDYARGLYDFEFSSARRSLALMWIILVVLIILQLRTFWLLDQPEQKQHKQESEALTKHLMVEILLFLVLVFGTIATTLLKGFDLL